jgi:DNA (cytosine-5)-methyltransferase 1
MKKQLSHIELFAGIGGFRRGIDLFCQDNGLIPACKAFSEIDKYANISYKENFEIADELEIGDIVDFTSRKENIESLPNFDLLTGGFPCQAFSMMGEQKGFTDGRGILFYNIIEILKIKKPKYVLLENVRNIINHDKGRTFKEINRSLEEDAGYKVFTDVFNTSDFGLPQTRRRVFFFAIRKDLTNNLNIDIFSSKKVKENFSTLNGKTSLHRYKNVLDNLLEKDVDEKFYLSEKLKPTILSNGSKNFNSKSEINQLIARPLTATMVKMHRACQDNYYSDEFLNYPNPIQYLQKDLTKQEQVSHRIRKITPLEALKLQGFDNDFYVKASSAGISNHQLYKQAGNAVSVNTVYSILHFLYKNEIIKF